MNRLFGHRFTVALLFLVLSYAVAQAQPSSLPPLVPCDGAAEGMPCIDIVTEVEDIVGTWRRYYQGGAAMAYSVIREDGTFSIVQSLPGDDSVSGIVRFEDGLAAFTANPDGPAPPACMEPGLYELRLVRVGERPVALFFSLMGEDHCAFRVGDFSMPMISYGGSGEELAMDPDVAALAQPLVPCPEEADEPYPCDVVATRAEDAAGIWRNYVGRPDLMAPGGMGYYRINHDGSFVIADAAENTAAPFGNYPFGSFAFEDGEVRVRVDAPGIPPTCATAIHRFHVYRFGAQNVALLAALIEDECAPRLQDMGRPIIWVADVE